MKKLLLVLPFILVIFSLVHARPALAQVNTFRCRWEETVGECWVHTEASNCVINDYSEEEAFCAGIPQDECVFDTFYNCLDEEAGPTPTPENLPDCPESVPDYECYADETCGGLDNWYVEPGYSCSNTSTPVCCYQSAVPPTPSPTPDPDICWKPIPDWDLCLTTGGQCCFETDDPGDFGVNGCLYYSSLSECEQALQSPVEERFYRCSIEDHWICLETSEANAQFLPPNALGNCESVCSQFAGSVELAIWCDSGGDPTIVNTTDKLHTAIGCIPISGGDQFISFFLRWAIGIAGGVALILIVYAGVQILTSGGDPKKTQAGKELLTAAVTGFIFLLLAVYLLELIGVDILNIAGF